MNSVWMCVCVSGFVAAYVIIYATVFCGRPSLVETERINQKSLVAGLFLAQDGALRVNTHDSKDN